MQVVRRQAAGKNYFKNWRQLTSKAEFPVKGLSQLTIRPAKNVLGALRLPGDKSVSHRYAMLAALATGTTRLANFSTGADCASTLSCLRQLGCVVRSGTDHAASGTSPVEIEGRERLTAPAASLDCGNSGSTMRMLSGILAGHDFACDLHKTN